MAFNKNITKNDLDFLDSLYEVAKKSKRLEDYYYYSEQVEILIGDLSDPKEFLAYLHKVEELYKEKDEAEWKK